MRFDYDELRRLRKENYLRQCDVGKMMHCSTSNICKWESRQLKLTIDDFVRLSEIYGVRDFNRFFIDRRK